MLGILVRFRTLIGQGGIAKDTFTQKHKQPPIFNKRDRILMRGECTFCRRVPIEMERKMGFVLFIAVLFA